MWVCAPGVSIVEAEVLDFEEHSHSSCKCPDRGDTKGTWILCKSDMDGRLTSEPSLQMLCYFNHGIFLSFALEQYLLSLPCD